MWQLTDEHDHVVAIYRTSDYRVAREACSAANLVLKNRVPSVELEDGRVVSGHHAVIDGHGWHIGYVNDDDIKPRRICY